MKKSPGRPLCFAVKGIEIEGGGAVGDGQPTSDQGISPYGVDIQYEWEGQPLCARVLAGYDACHAFAKYLQSETNRRWLAIMPALQVVLACLDATPCLCVEGKRTH
jgi:hypothetical protein